MIALETMAVIQGQRSNAGHRCEAVVSDASPEFRFGHKGDLATCA